MRPKTQAHWEQFATLPLRGRSRNAIYILPSTLETLTLATKWSASDPSLSIVEPQLQGGMSSMEFLHLMGTASHSHSLVAIVFSDQFVTPLDAPVLVRQGDETIYYSAVELIALRSYGFIVHAWTGQNFESLDAPSDEIRVIRLLRRHLSACEGLEGQWLSKDAQTRGVPANRSHENRIRLRSFHSALMHATQRSPLSPSLRQIATRILEIE